MEDSNLLIGALFSAVFIGAALLHMRENAQLERELQTKADPTTYRWVIRFAWSRTFQLLGALACAIMLIISYDREISTTRSNLDTLSAAVKQMSQLEQERAQDQKLLLEKLSKIAAASQAPAQVVVVPQPAPAANPLSQVAPASAAPLGLVAQAPIGSNINPQPAPVTNRAQQAANSRNAAINELYNPGKVDEDQQSAMDDIKRRYEDILVIHLFLKRCGKVNTNDYGVISSALVQEMTAIDAPSRLQNDIIASAQGSYSEIYSKSPCDGTGIADLNEQYINYIKILSTNFATQEQ